MSVKSSAMSNRSNMHASRDTPVGSDSRVHDECDSAECFLPTTRRRFLRDTFLTVAGALVAVGMSTSAALAMPIELASAVGAAGTTRQYALPSTDGAVIDKDNEVILVRWQGAMYAFSLSCPHQNTALKWDDRDHAFQCPKHHSKFQPNGSYIADSGRATRNMDRFAITRDSTGVSVDIDKLYQEDTDNAQWAGAVIKV
jgi:nitrite reductase/ring-hydroxylating ferredoxin subunit